MSLNLTHDAAQGLLLHWNAIEAAIPIRARISGSHNFQVWSVIDSGETPPVWAEPELALTLFGGNDESPDTTHRIEYIHDERGVIGCRAFAHHPRIEAALELRLEDDALTTRLTLANPQGIGGQHLPLCLVELAFNDLPIDTESEFHCAHCYGGRTHGYGKIARVTAPGVNFVHGCIGQALPLVYLHDHLKQKGLEFEFMTDGRPEAWLKPSDSGVNWSVSWAPDRLLAPGQTHMHGGRLALRAYKGMPVQQMRNWRDAASARYGIQSPTIPAWARHATSAPVWLAPNTESFPFARLDDLGVPDFLKQLRESGFTAIFGVAPNHTGLHMLSPYDYLPREETGGFAAERQFLDWAHEAGIHCYMWVTTVGLDRNSDQAQHDRDFWTQRANGDYFYAWDSKAPDYLGYAPDGDPFSKGWRLWLEDQVRQLVQRGWDGIYIDGCIPRASNHGRWDWPGAGRDGIADQVTALANVVRETNPEAAVFIEDGALYAQAAYGVVTGRYFVGRPFFKVAYADHGMGGGPETTGLRPQFIPHEMARDYLLTRYASLLPGSVSLDSLNGFNSGYYSEAMRPWVAQTVFAGNAIHADMPFHPEEFRPHSELEEPSDFEKTSENRLRGHEEFLDILRFAQAHLDLVRDAPFSIEGAAIGGSDTVVGLLRPTAQRALLAVLNFGPNAAEVKVKLAEPVDVPQIQRATAGEPQRASWRTKELMRSMIETEAMAESIISGIEPLSLKLKPFSFRVFELTIDTGEERA